MQIVIVDLKLSNFSGLEQLADTAASCSDHGFEQGMTTNSVLKHAACDGWELVGATVKSASPINNYTQTLYFKKSA